MLSVPSVALSVPSVIQLDPQELKGYTEAIMERRRVVGEKLIDLGNITAGALIFGQALSAEQLSGLWLIVGVLVMACLYWVGVVIIPKEAR